MKHILKIMALLVAISAFWIGLLETSVVSRKYTWLMPVYFVVSLGCYGLLMVGVGLMFFPTCPQEALLLQKIYRGCQSRRRKRGAKALKRVGSGKREGSENFFYS
ncbi:dolichol-phosphate mannose synthase subunit 3-like isoform X1 [Tasmannia lanceolata]|uniref:dolichol-phosphate mannose synthase subunit 3-like isoform X1 n=1 Tax=Tasmannia lanceolata TaxID=3420 RepID=UPI004062F1E8